MLIQIPNSEVTEPCQDDIYRLVFTMTSGLLTQVLLLNF